MEVNCTNCKKEFNKKPSTVGENNFCSQVCYREYNKGKKRNFKDSKVGNIYGLLKVIKQGKGKTYKDGSKVRTWVVECECGTEKEIATHNLKNLKSCGCLVKKPTHNWKYNNDRVEAVAKEKYLSYKKGAKKRDLKFKLTFPEFFELIKQDCYYCGEVDDFKGSNQDGTILIGIDRINNDRGYIKNNSVPCCKACNYMKRTMNVNDFINKCIKISNNVTNK